MARFYDVTLVLADGTTVTVRAQANTRETAKNRAWVKHRRNNPDGPLITRVSDAVYVKPTRV